MPVSNFGNLEIDLLVMLIMIMLVIWIKEGHSQVMYSPLVDVPLVGKQVCKLQLLYLQWKPSVWLFLRHAKKLFG